MDDNKVLIRLKDERVRWPESLHLTKEEALKVHNLSVMRKGTRVELPSIQGSAEVKAGRLEVHYWSTASKCEKIISVPVAVATDAMLEALNGAEEERRTERAWDRIWDWVNERYHGTQVLTLAAGEQVSATVIHRENQFLAVMRADGSAAIVDRLNEEDIPAIGATVVLAGDANGGIIIEP